MAVRVLISLLVHLRYPILSSYADRLGGPGAVSRIYRIKDAWFLEAQITKKKPILKLGREPGGWDPILVLIFRLSLPHVHGGESKFSNSALR